jgi:putative effector of murein hydrolase
MEYFSNDFFLIALTFGTYFLGKLLRRLTGWVVMNPILISIACIIAFLKKAN